MLSSVSSTVSRQLKVTVNGRVLDAKKGETIIELCDRSNIKIPRLCYHPNLPLKASCRVCLVETNGGWLSAACTTQVWDGLEVKTKSPKVTQFVRNNLRQLLEHHDEKCSSCVANNRCEFRDLIYSYGVTAEGRETPKPQEIDASTNSIVLDTSKCVLCGRCIRACEEFSGQSAIEFGNRASHMTIQPAGGVTLQETNCVKCGQCTLYCPVGAITEKSQVQQMLEALQNRPKKTMVVQVAPAIRVNISDALGLPAGTISTGKLVTALKKLGFDYVFDTNYSADLTILEEATELVKRLGDPKATLPMFTSCCPAWINYVEQSRPEFIPNLSSCRSPQGMLSSCIKNIFPKSIGVQPEDIFSVSIMPCTAKKDEIERPQLRTKGGLKETDVVLTTRELAEMIKLSGIDFNTLEDTPFDKAFGESSGAGAIFAATGGVMEAAARTAFETVTGKKLTNVNLEAIRGLEHSRIASLDLDGTVLKVAVAHGISDAGKLLDRLKAKDEQLKDVKFIEVMACPGGCVCGGGSPAIKNHDVVEKRLNAIYEIDTKSQVRKSHENQSVMALYKDVLGEPNSHLAHELLHTHYHDRSHK